MHAERSALLTDLYQLNMIQAYLDEGFLQDAVFEFFFRRLPKRRAFLLAAGLEQALDYLESMRFKVDEIDWLRSTGRFRQNCLDYLSGLRFTGDVYAMPEGTVFFADEPILRIVAPLPLAQLVETRLINILHFQCLIASKATRMKLAAPGKRLVDFGLRRAHGADAGLLAARASYVAGFDGTATMLAESEFGIPTFGTMAHSYIQAHDDETEAFERFARARPESLTLLLDTYDTVAAARKVVALAPKLRAQDITIRSVRLDSGDLLQLSQAVRGILDDGGLAHISILASGGLDEDALATLVQARAPIDAFGIGTSLTTSSDVPALDCAYKLQEYAGRPRRKTSSGKATWPGRKQVWRRYATDASMAGDLVALESEPGQGEALLVPVMRNGKRARAAEGLDAIRTRAADHLKRLPAALRSLETETTYPVEISAAIRSLAQEMDRRTGAIGKNL